MDQEKLLAQFDHFNKHVSGLFNDPNTSLQEKIERLVHFYIDMIIEYPEVAPFIFSEARSDVDGLVSKMKVVHEVNESVMAMQIRGLTGENRKDIHPQNYVMNIISMCVFPLIAGNMIRKYGKLDDDTYNAMMQQRKSLIPIWAMGMIKGTAI